LSVVLLKSKSISLLCSLSKKELSAFSYYLRWDYLTVNKYIRKAFPYLKQIATRKKFNLSKEVLYRICFGKEKYNDKKIRYLLTDLYKLLEKFLLIESVISDKQNSETLLAKQLALKNTEKAYKSFTKKIALQKSHILNADYYLAQYNKEHHHLTYYISKLNRKEKTNIEKVASNLDAFYLARKLQLCCEIFNYQNVLTAEYKIFLMDEFLQALQTQEYASVPVISIYHKILLTLTQPDVEENFFFLLELLKKNEQNFSIDELRDMFSYAFNYCIKKINLGNQSFRLTLCNTYKLALQNKVLYKESCLSQWDFKNIVTLSLRLNDFKWCYDFIETQKEYLPANEKENAYNYNLANYYFFKKEFSKTLKLLHKVSFTDIYYQLDSRSVLLKTYYETSDLDALQYHITAFRNFLKRNHSVSEYQLSIYSNLVKYTQRLLAAGNSKTKLLKLKKEVALNKSVADVQWLEQKIEDLI
jgi:hypothetical protein